jgi:hypothetical protein
MYGIGRFNGDDIIAMGSEPHGIAAEAGAKVEDRCTGRGEHIEHRCTHIFEHERRVLPGQRTRVLLVVENNRHRGWS